MRAATILALTAAALAATSANAQVVSRSISEEPVETTVTQTADGTIVTRRPLNAEAPRVVATRKTTVRRSVRVDRGRDVVTRTVREPVAAIALSPAERHIVYRKIVERNVLPAPRIVPPGPYAVPYNAPVVARDEDDDVVVTAPRYDRYEAAYTIGSVLPANVPLFAVPQEVGYRVPAAQPYSYAYVGGRAYLVDPATGVIVADVTE